MREEYHTDFYLGRYCHEKQKEVMSDDDQDVKSAE